MEVFTWGNGKEIGCLESGGLLRKGLILLGYFEQITLLDR